MKLKLTYQEFMSLYMLFQQLCNKQVCEEMEDKLLHVLLTCVYIKLHKLSVFKKEKYSVKLSEAEAINFWIALNDNNLNAASFEGNLINIICADIHQKFS